MALYHAQNLPTGIVDKRVRAGGTGTFALSIKKWAEATNLDIDTVKRKIAFDVAARLVMRTPVDTGKARANWMVGVGSVNQSTTDDEDKAGSSTITALAQDIKMANAKDDTSIFITNSLPYIARLEYGFSQQAPEGMVRLTVAEFSGIAASAVDFVSSTSGTGRLE